MRILNMKIVDSLFGQNSQGFSDFSMMDLLADDVTYYLRILRSSPVSHTFRGKKEVCEYLFDILPLTYRILEEKNRNAFMVGNSVVVFGGERAQVVRLNQMVETNWCAVIVQEKDKIQSITMSLHGWRVQTAAQPSLVRSI